MIRPILRNAGIRPAAMLRALHGWRRYVAQRNAFRRMHGADSMPWGSDLPMLTEWDEVSGSLGGYFYQDLTVARWVHDANPHRHLDVGSRLDGFIGHLATFREVEVLDIRPQLQTVPNVRFHQLDLMQPLPYQWMACTDSLSCLHTIEHFGLGRYGDSLAPDGHLKGLEQLVKMVRPGGTFYLSTVVGRERLEFNAHRVFAPRTMLSWFENGWEIQQTALIDDQFKLTTAEDSSALICAKCDTGVGILAAKKMG